MSTFKHPVGRKSANVYWRRRIVVLLCLLAVIAVILLIVLRPGSGNAAPEAAVTKTPHPTTSATAAPTPNPTVIPTVKASAAGESCDPKNVDVEAITDASSYGAGQLPLLSLSLTNTGTVMCTIDAGTATQIYTITSGSEQYWTSTDCQKNPVHTVIKLEPGKTLTSTPLSWDRTRSSASTCDKQRAAVPAGGASYHLKVSVGGVASAKSKQFLLNG